MSNQQAAAKLEIARQQLVEAIALLTSSPQPGAPRPPRETAPAYDACRPMVDRAVLAGLLTMSDYDSPGIQQGQDQMFAPRMSQAKQDALENDIRALGRSEWGQEWLSHDENAALIDRRYCYYWVGYWLIRASHNPDDGYFRRTDNPGMLPV